MRAVITEENSEIIEEKVTVELHKRLVEDANFDNVSSTEKDKPYLYPYDPDDPQSQKVSELSSYTGKIIGPAKVMAVKKGEKIDLSTKYWYTEVPGEPLTSIAEILAGTLLNLGSASSGIIPEGPETGMALLNNVSGNQFGSFSNFINDAFDNVDFSKPQAFIVYMYFDKNMNLDPRSSGIIQVTTANTLGYLSRSNIVPRTDGFFYTYVTNRSEGKVNFDNMTVTRWAPKVRVTYDYYPYGLTWENPTIPSDPNAIHDHCYQDKEFQFSEFATGHGLALYDFHARMYDPAMGRWLVPDPAAQFANPYLAMGNNPAYMVDPNGQFSINIGQSEFQYNINTQLNLPTYEVNLTTFQFPLIEFPKVFSPNFSIYLPSLPTTLETPKLSDQEMLVYLKTHGSEGGGAGWGGSSENQDSGSDLSSSGAYVRSLEIQMLMNKYPLLFGGKSFSTWNKFFHGASDVFTKLNYLETSLNAVRVGAINWRSTLGMARSAAFNSRFTSVMNTTGLGLKYLAPFGKIFGTPLSILTNVSDYSNNLISTERFWFRNSAIGTSFLAGELATIGLGASMGGLVGFGVAGSFVAAEIFYDGANWWTKEMSIGATNWESAIQSGLWLP